MRRIEEAQQRSELEEKARVLAEKRRKEAAEARRKEKQKEKVVESSEESDEESNKEDNRDPGPSVPKKRKLQDTVSKTIDEKDRY